MSRLLFLLLLITTPLLAERITIDPSCRSFEMHPPKKERVETFDFAGTYPELENIDVNARRKKNVEFFLTGEYPVLETVNYIGSFGVLKGELTGHFPKLSLVNFICTSCAMELDLETQWQNSCEINIQGGDANIVLNLPKDVGLVIHTKTGLKGKVIASDDLKKQKWYKIVNKTFHNSLVETAPITLTITIQAGESQIFLN